MNKSNNNYKNLISKILSPSFRIVVIYFLISFIWILASDRIIELIVDDIEVLNYIQTIKGWFFITITSVIIYFLINHYLKKEMKLRNEIENIFEYSATPIFIFNEDGKILKTNNSIHQLTKYNYLEINTIDKFITNVLSSEDFKKVKTLFEKNYKINKKIALGEFYIKTKDEEDLIWHFDLSPYGIKDGKSILICTCVDITELRKKEALLLQQSKMATMGEMIGSIAHQWKQPLSLIKMSNSLIRLKKDDNSFISNEDENKALENIDNAIINIDQTIEDFRNFFNPNKKITEFNIKKTFEKTLKLIDSQFNHNNIEVIKKIDEIIIHGLENELLQVLINLLKNAKEQLLKLETNRVLFIDCFEKNQYVIIEIKDNGGGIDNTIINRVFDQYFTTKEEESGSGIGLYISKVIIDEHMNGKLSVQNSSIEYKNHQYLGAKFIISIPKDLNQ